MVTSTPAPPLPPAIRAARCLGIIRRLDPEPAYRIANTLLDAGIGAVEVTIDSPSAESVLKRLSSGGAGDRVGAGTILDKAAARRAVAAGAHFLVSPHTDTSLIEWCRRHGIAILPGALTPTEVIQAVRAGASAIKLFPAGSVGPEHVSSLLGPWPTLDLVPTGGVSADNAPDWIAAGACAVAVGGWLCAGGREHEAARRARELLDAIGSVEGP